MLDIKFIRENLDILKQAAAKKHVDVDFDRLVELDDKRISEQQQYDRLRSEQNQMGQIISQQKTENDKEISIAKMKTVKDELQKVDERIKEILKEWQAIMICVPNVPDMSVPDGDSEADNKELRKYGNLPKFDFKPKGHIEIMQSLGMLDLDRGAKTSGFRGYYLVGDGALLSFALWQFVIDEFVKSGEFKLAMAPSLVRKEPFIGTGYLPQGEDDLYVTQDGDYLAGTAEVGMMGYHMDEVLDASVLPVKYLAFSPCFRREAGSHGKDTKGIVRVHEFFKLEQVILCEANHEVSVRHHEELTLNAEKLLQKLELPYRVVINCGADIGLGQVKKYDIEAWVPSEERYLETHSSSYFHDFQSRRLNIRYRDASGKLRFVHSLNNTALATPRILVSIIENYQNDDGSVRIPKALRHYMNKDSISLNDA